MFLNKYIRSLFYGLIIVIIGSLITTILSYFNLIDSNTTNYFQISTIVISLFISGLYIGKKAINKKYFEGLKIGFITVLISIIISLITKSGLKGINIIYYLIIIISSTLGSMIANNNKKNNSY